jgi:hypothetical protein
MQSKVYRSVSNVILRWIEVAKGRGSVALATEEAHRPACVFAYHSHAYPSILTVYQDDEGVEWGPRL